jgi:hypothetical protein
LAQAIGVVLVVLLLCVPSHSCKSKHDASSNIAAPLETLIERAKNGNAAAQFLVGKKYHNGEGLPQNHSESARWWLMAANQGHADAQESIAENFHGSGNYSEALRWYRKAAEQGNATAQYGLGQLYDGGLGVPQDFTEAVRWYRKSAEQGNYSAQSTLAERKVVQDHAEAARWYRTLAEKGLAWAQYDLAGLYLTGRGVTHDLVAAHMWANLAASRVTGDLQQIIQPTYATRRDEIAEKMTPVQIAEAQRRAREWRPQNPAQ